MIKMDKLEDFIRENRQGLDQRSPSPEIWDRISGHGYHSARRRMLIRVSSAAMIAIIMGTAVLFYSRGSRMAVISRTRDEEIMKANPGLREAEIYYNTMYNSLLNEASPLFTSNPEVEKELINDLSQVDSICISIKKDLKDNVSNQEVIEALISNYRTKIRILEDMLKVLKENENNHGKGDQHAL